MCIHVCACVCVCVCVRVSLRKHTQKRKNTNRMVGEIVVLDDAYVVVVVGVVHTDS